MITSIHFQNFRSLRDATLPLGAFTLIVGPNGSGKSTAMQAFNFVHRRSPDDFRRLISAELREAKDAVLEVSINWYENGVSYDTGLYMKKMGSFFSMSLPPTDGPRLHAHEVISNFQQFAFDAEAIAAEVETNPNPEIVSNGSNLAAVLDALRDSRPEKFEELNDELHRWLPEFDRILFRTPARGKKAFMVRSTVGQYVFDAHDLSQGVLFALAFLTLAYLPDPPSIVCFEEPDRGMHPRLLVDIRDAMYRLAFPEEYGEKRSPVQVIATTHSPYLLDLYKDHPEQIVIAHKDEQGAHFERLSEKPHLNEILEGAPLGEIWYSGILGGVPRTP